MCLSFLLSVLFFYITCLPSWWTNVSIIIIIIIIIRPTISIRSRVVLLITTDLLIAKAIQADTGGVQWFTCNMNMQVPYYVRKNVTASKRDYRRILPPLSLRLLLAIITAGDRRLLVADITRVSATTQSIARRSGQQAPADTIPTVVPPAELIKYPQTFNPCCPLFTGGKIPLILTQIVFEPSCFWTAAHCRKTKTNLSRANNRSTTTPNSG